MKQLLIDTCETFIKALDILKSEEKISQEEYDQYVKLKLEFLNTYSSTIPFKSAL